MSNAAVDMAAVTAFVLEHADSDNLNSLAQSIRARRKILGEIAAATITVGTAVTTHNLNPAYMDGLSGVVKTISRRGHGKATVTLDQESTRKLADISGYTYLASRDSYDLEGVPLRALKVTSG